MKRSVGIDISKDSFTSCVCQCREDFSLSFSEVGTFKNDKRGFNQFIKWVRKTGNDLSTVNFLMEATGVYYESLAFHLDKIKLQVNVVLPNTSKHYFQSLNAKTKTDKIDARLLAQFAVERKHPLWHRPNPLYLSLRNLTRFYVQLQEQKTAFTNLKHSKVESEEVQQLIINLNQKTIDHLDKQIVKVTKEIGMLCKSDATLWAKIEKLCSIKGLGLITVATIVAETFGFEHIRNGKQLASYAGYDVVQKESGSSVKGKTRISKKGNKYLRNALYFPAMVSCRYNPQMKENYLRITKTKESKMIGQVAIQRKLLLLTYTLWKNDTVYDPEYKKVAPTKVEATQDSIS